MAIVTTDDRHYKAIADKIRETVSGVSVMPDQMPTAIEHVKSAAHQTGWESGYHNGKSAGYTEGYDSGQEAGYERGRNEGYDSGFANGRAAGIEQGVQAEYDRFWDAYRNNIKESSAANAFSYYGWNDTTYNPNGTLYVGWGANSMYYASRVTDTKVPISLAGVSSNISTLFGNSHVHTVNKLIVDEITPLHNAFTNANNLANITFEGVIAKACNMQWCPLTEASIRDVVEHLSDTATGVTATFNKAAKEAAFTDEEWSALIATKPNWTFSLL